MALVNCTAGATIGQVLEGVLASPRIGAWRAELAIDATDASAFAPGTAVTIDIGDGQLQLKGTVRTCSDAFGSLLLRVVGGAGGLNKPTTPKHYKKALLRDPLNDLLSAAGEKLASDADQSALATSLPFWTVLAQTVGLGMSALAPAAGAATVWRVKADGAVYLGPESWPSSSLDYEVIAPVGNERLYQLAFTYPVLMAGVELEGIGKVSYVEHRILHQGVRSSVYVE